MILELFEKPSNNLLHIDSDYIYEIVEIKGGSKITLKVKDEYFVYEVYEVKSRIENLIKNGKENV